ncbi:MAG: hypothetical protein ACRDZO_21245 [Egibacteraceae bacterium]
MWALLVTAGIPSMVAVARRSVATHLVTLALAICERTEELELATILLRDAATVLDDHPKLSLTRD